MKKVRSEELGVRSSGCCAWPLSNKRLAPRGEVCKCGFCFFRYMSRAPFQSPTSAAPPKGSLKKKAEKIKMAVLYRCGAIVAASAARKRFRFLYRKKARRKIPARPTPQVKHRKAPTNITSSQASVQLPAHFSGVSVKKILAASGIRFLLR